MRSVSGFIVAAAAGVVYGLCFPPLSWRPLAWVALAPLLVTIRRTRSSRAPLLAGLYGIAGMFTTVDWLPRTVATYYEQPYLVGIALFLGLMFLMVVPWTMAFGAFYKLLAGRAGPFLPLLAASAWVTGELARSTFLTGNPWVLFGYSLVGIDHLVQIADITSVYGPSFVLVTVNAALAELYLWIRSTDTKRQDILGSLLCAIGIVAVVLGYGHLRLRAQGASEPANATKVALIQAHIDLGARWRQDMYGRNLDAYLQLTYRILEKQAPQLVLWPENAMTFFLADEPLYQTAIARALAPFDAELIAGGPYARKGESTTYYNSAFVLAPEGRITGRYDKEKLLPFTEYFPLPSLDLLQRSFGRVREFTPGDATQPLPTIAGRAGVLICNEAMFPTIARRRVRAGAEYLVNLSNDTWMNDWQFSSIMFDMSVLRAIELRRYVVRISTSGPSAIIDPFGRVSARTGFSVREVETGWIAPRTEMTFYARYGDVFAHLCAIAVIVALVWALARQRTNRRRTEPTNPGASART